MKGETMHIPGMNVVLTRQPFPEGQMGMIREKKDRDL